MSKHIVDFQNRLYASEQRASVSEQGKRNLEEEIATLNMLHTGSADFQMVVASEIEILGETMAVVYEEMEKLHHTIAPIVAIQTHSKERVSMLKEAMTALDKIHEWSENYPKALTVVPRKDWIAMQNTRA